MCLHHMVDISNHMLALGGSHDGSPAVQVGMIIATRGLLLRIAQNRHVVMPLVYATSRCGLASMTRRIPLTCR